MPSPNEGWFIVFKHSIYSAKIFPKLVFSKLKNLVANYLSPTLSFRQEVFVVNILFYLIVYFHLQMNLCSYFNKVNFHGVLMLNPQVFA